MRMSYLSAGHMLLVGMVLFEEGGPLLPQLSQRSSSEWRPAYERCGEGGDFFTPSI